jgi:hypothetical protein
MSTYRPLTIQLGDVTYGGEWRRVGDRVLVRCPFGERGARTSWWRKSGPVAERLLLELLREGGAL